MDGTQFDDLTRRLDAVRSRRTIARLLGGGALVGSLAAWGLGEAEAKKKKQKKKPVCTCTATGCTSQKVKNRSKVINQNPRCNYAGGCTTNPCAATVPPSPPGPPPCQNSTQCTGGQVCTSGACVNCTSYTQCGTLPTAGHKACFAEGRCRGGENCTPGGTPCTHPLTCLLPQTPGSTQHQCLVGNQCDADDDCVVLAPNIICVLGKCTRACVQGADCTPVGMGFTCQGGVCLPA
jgi:hypothetical protein